MNVQPLVGIVIVNYNGAGYQNDCIYSILKCGYENYKIIIVDNASTDNSMQLLDDLKDGRIIKIFNKENGGVAQGNNIGIRKSFEEGCEYTLLLNNDVVVTQDFLQELIFVKEDIVCPKIYYYGTRNRIWYAGGKFLRLKGRSTHFHMREEDCNITYKKYYSYAPTCCILIRNNVFERVGLFDEKYFLYFDDTDFMYRAYKMGYKVCLCTNAVIYHKVSLSTGGEKSPIVVYYDNRNRFYFIQKHHLGLSAKVFSYLTRYIKIMLSKLKKTNEWKYIREAIKDYKNGKMYRKEDLKKIGQ